MLDPTAEEVVLHVQLEAVGLVGLGPGPDLLGQFRRHHLIGINNQDPVVLEGQRIKRPVLLLRIRAVEVELHDARPVLLGHEHGRVVALTVDHEDLVRPGQRRQASPEVLRLVLDRDDHAHRRPGDPGLPRRLLDHFDAAFHR